MPFMNLHLYIFIHSLLPLYFTFYYYKLVPFYIENTFQISNGQQIKGLLFFF